MTFLDVVEYLFSAAITAWIVLSPLIVEIAAYTSGNESVGDAARTIATVEPHVPDISPLESFDAIVQSQLRADNRYQQAAAIDALSTSSSASGASIETALVNIFCTARGEDSIRTITGSGVFIDTHGVILTNAHIAQFLLLSEETAEVRAGCVIRQGSPALSKYEAELLYISPAWIKKNAHQLSAPNPSGTGEQDFALLHVIDAFEGDVPETFPFLTPEPTAAFFKQMPVRAAGYPAETLTPENVRAPLSPIVATTTVTDLFTFGADKEIDLVAIAPSSVGRQGSSGGPIVDEEGMVVGLITTRGNSETEGDQSLRALTLSYINRVLREETDLDLAHTLAGDRALRGSVFRETIAPHLRAFLLDTQ